MSGMTNVVVDALSKRYYLFIIMINKLEGFEEMKDEYGYDEYFGKIYSNLSKSDQTCMFSFKDYFLIDRFLFKENQICIPFGFRREQLVRDLHSNGLSGHFRMKKTFRLVKEKLFYPSMR